MSKFACPERRLSCGKGCANALLPEARKHLPNWGPRRRSGHFGPRSILREPGTAARVRSLLVSAQPCLSRARRQSAGTVQRKAIIGFPKARPRERDQPACASAPSSTFYRNWGGKRYSVIAKIRYTISTSTPTNHAERPPLVNRNAVSVEMSTITTAPGQNCRLIGAGAMT